MIASPSCYYNSTMECFITLGDNMVYSTGQAEIYTSPPQLQDLIEICGTEGFIWLSAQIELDVNSAVNELMKIVQVKFCSKSVYQYLSSFLAKLKSYEHQQRYRRVTKILK